MLIHEPTAQGRDPRVFFCIGDVGKNIMTISFLHSHRLLLLLLLLLLLERRSRVNKNSQELRQKVNLFKIIHV